MGAPGKKNSKLLGIKDSVPSQTKSLGGYTIPKVKQGVGLKRGYQSSGHQYGTNSWELPTHSRDGEFSGISEYKMIIVSFSKAPPEVFASSLYVVHYTLCVFPLRVVATWN